MRITTPKESEPQLTIRLRRSVVVDLDEVREYLLRDAPVNATMSRSAALATMLRVYREHIGMAASTTNGEE